MGKRGTGHFPREKVYRLETTFEAESDLSPFSLL